LRARNVEDYLAAKGIQVWSADFLADDWRHISPARVYELAIKRLEERHKGILLLHDIHARTVAALPKILHEMKVRGYHVVQVVPATPDRPATPTDPQDWQPRPPPESLPVAELPKVPTFVFAEAERLVTSPSDFTTPDGKLLLSGETFDKVKRPIEGTSAASDAWPTPNTQAVKSAVATLPAPSQSLFQLPGKTQPALPQTVAVAHAGGPAMAPQTAAPSSKAGTPHGPVAVMKARHRARLARNLHRQAQVAPAAKAETMLRARAEKKTGPRRPVKLASLKRRER
jgi:hypothetical protein